MATCCCQGETNSAKHDAEQRAEEIREIDLSAISFMSLISRAVQQTANCELIFNRQSPLLHQPNRLYPHRAAVAQAHRVEAQPADNA
jgi:hypothetical protein